MWNRPDVQGEFRIVCTELPGNVCADYAIGYSLKKNDRIQRSHAHEHSGQDAEEICHPGVLHSGHIDFNDCLQVAAWFATPNIPYIRCYLWVTPDGHLPQKQALSNDPSNTIDKIVSTPF